MDTTNPLGSSPNPNSNPDPNFPPESFYVSTEDEIDWYDNNAYYDRSESTKGGLNQNYDSVPNSSTNLNPGLNSTKFSKASMIGLPKVQKSNFVVAGLRQKKGSKVPKFFPKRGGSVKVGEPGSPKVSCIGRVRSKKERRRRLRNSRRKTEPFEFSVGSGEPSRIGNVLVEPGRSTKNRAGFWSSLRAALKLGCQKKLTVEVDDLTVEDVPRRSVTLDNRKIVFGENMGLMGPGNGVSGGGGPPGLGGLNKFASGRRSSSWGGNGDVGGIEVLA